MGFRIRLLRWIALTAVVIALSPGKAHAINITGPLVDYPAAPSTSINGVGAANANLGTLSAGPSVSATLNSGNYANAQLIYYFEVIGSTTDTDNPANVDVTASGTTSGTPLSVNFYGSASAALDIIPPTSLEVPYGSFFQLDDGSQVFCQTGDCIQSDPNFILTDDVFSVPINEPMEVNITALTSITVGSGTLSAMLDPMITLDPTDVSGLSLDFSAGINQPGVSPSPVPEPSSLPMLLAGLGLVGGAFYFRRKRMMAS